MLFTVAFEHVEQSRLFWQPPCECTPWLWRARRYQVRRLIDRCAGIDVGQALLVVRVVSERGRLVEEVRSFGATTPDLLACRTGWRRAREHVQPR